ncbi:hypothetical protein LTR10_005312 [Elasticomyces elasticus]|nr:hypothetical protein LTR10_005312 [Elasticomyces elasticus]KAK4976048.1 hypothetical protein LTR42_003673 [Elasticomyces elasticus]
MVLTKQPKYSSGNVEQVFKAVVDKRMEAMNDLPRKMRKPRFRSESNMCQTFVTTLFSSTKHDLRARKHLMRSYDRLAPQPSRPEQNGAPIRKMSYANPEFSKRRARQLTNDTRRSIEDAATELEIWQVARAAIAGTKYFSPLIVQNAGNAEIRHEDAALNIPNPTREGLDEIERQHGRKSIGTVVSIGTARADNLERDESAMWFPDAALRVVEVATNPELVHQAVQNMSNERGFEYFRFNPENQSDRLSIEFDEWRPGRARKGLVAGSHTLESMKWKFDRWYDSDERIRDMFHDCANELVGRRRKRVLNSARWERYITGKKFRCRFDECSDGNLTFTLRDQFEQHCKSKHAAEPGFNLDEEVNGACRGGWQYQPKKRGKDRVEEPS